MKKNTALLIAGVLASFAFPISASTTDAWGSRGDVWIGAKKFNYDEPGYMNESGNLISVGISSTYDFGHNWALKAQTNFDFGETRYDGRATTGESLITDTQDYIFDSQLKVGYSIDGFKGSVTPFTGLGLRQWQQKIASGINAAGIKTQGYSRAHRYVYSPIGVTYQLPVGQSYIAELRGEYRHIHNATAIAYLEGVDSMST